MKMSKVFIKKGRKNCESDGGKGKGRREGRGGLGCIGLRPKDENIVDSDF